MIGKVKKYVSVHMKIAYWDEEPLFCAWQSCIHSHLVISKYPSLFTEGQRRFYAHFLGVHFWAQVSCDISKVISNRYLSA